MRFCRDLFGNLGGEAESDPGAGVSKGAQVAVVESAAVTEPEAIAIEGEARHDD